MLKVGLTGGYATGKSFVAKELEALGCFVIYADRLGHQVLAPAGSAYKPVLAIFGTEILAPDGTIDRKKLGAIVFASPELLNRLNSIVHPAVFQLEEQALAEHPHGITIIEAAILIETGRYTNFDKLIVTTCDEETQIARGMERDHLSREEIAHRLSKQMPMADKTRFANYLIDTGGSPAETIAQVRRIHADLRQLAEASPA